MSETKLPIPRAKRWQILRAGLQNIWEYDDQRFVFHHGRLLLRGRNESGKTKAIEVLLPFLLDADLAPQRLDPFGSQSRPMRWNLINDQNPDVTTTIGYVWLELGRAGAQAEYCTIGAGLRAKRSTTGVEPWFFITSLRVDEGLQLFDERRVPLQRAKLEAVLGAEGVVHESKKEYRRDVIKRLFEMPEEQYGALIETLLQLRRPQLSKQLEPAELSRILSASLPPLEERVVGPLAEGFERLDRHRDERDALSRTLKAVQGFLSVYRNYVAAIAKARSQELTAAESAFHADRARLKEQEKEHELAVGAQAQLAEEIDRLDRDDRMLGERILTLKTSDEYRAVQALDVAEQQSRKDRGHATSVEERLRRERKDLAEERADLAEAEERAQTQTERLAEARTEATARAGDAALTTAHEAIDALTTVGQLDAARGTLRSIIERRNQAVDELSRHTKLVAEAGLRASQAQDRFRDAEERVRGSEGALADGEAAVETASEAFRTGVRSWAAATTELKLGHETLALPVDDVGAAITRAAGELQARLEEEAGEVANVLRERQHERDEVAQKRSELLERKYAPPAAPGWRGPRPENRAGSPLYLLCDFADHDSPHQGNIEAALEAAGLLDAWVTPDGALLDPGTLDVVLAAEPQSGPTLADWMTPTEAGGVSRSMIERVLQTIAIVEGSSCWVSPDGRWRVGPLHGEARKQAPVYIGATARERERSRQLAELQRKQDRVDDEIAGLVERSDRIRERRNQVSAELKRFPELRGVLGARAQVEILVKQLATERNLRKIALESRTKAESELSNVRAKRDAAAASLDLSSWVESLDELARLTYQYAEAAHDLDREASERAICAKRVRAVGTQIEQAERRVMSTVDEAEMAREEAELMEARAAALRETVGATRDEVLARVLQAETRHGLVRADLKNARDEKEHADDCVGETRGHVATVQAAVEKADRSRKHAEAQFRDFARGGVLAVAVAAIEVEGTPESWSSRDALLAARYVDSALGSVDASAEAREKAENRVNARHVDLTRELPPEVKMWSERSQGVLEYRATLQGRPRRLLELAGDLEDELASRDQLLGAEEQKLFESFLSGETHEHLRARLREAHALKDRMNVELERRPTASGMRLRLQWQVTEDAPAGTADAIGLFLRSGHLLSDADRSALREFLGRRLSEARTSDGVGSLQERMLAILDYRAWFSFMVEFKPLGGSWTRLTKKAHGAGSGGQKSVLLHLPLFAAAAAFYESAAKTAPRLIVLDEAFAGIDRPTRAQLMGFLAEFDLDFVMTSYEEWGFYEELDGLSTYHLAREPGVRGVYADWFIWDGKQAVQMESA